MPFSRNYFIRQYRIVKVIKADEVRRVSVAIYMAGLWFKKCIIKQTIKMRDRLVQQFKLLQDFQGQLPVPEPIEMFEEEKETFIVLKFVEGRNLQAQIDSIYKGRDFASLPVSRKQRLIGYYLRVLQSVKKLHDMGYAHRDIAPGNFLVDRKDNIHLLDLELASPVAVAKGRDYFPGWTKGYSCPEQVANRKPSVEQDIYSLGALMLMTFTHQHPRVLNQFTPSSLRNKLLAHKLPEYVAPVMVSCLNQNPRHRPALCDVLQCMEQFSDDIGGEVTQRSSLGHTGQKDIYW